VDHRSIFPGHHPVAEQDVAESVKVHVADIGDVLDREVVPSVLVDIAEARDSAPEPLSGLPSLIGVKQRLGRGRRREGGDEHGTGHGGESAIPHGIPPIRRPIVLGAPHSAAAIVTGQQLPRVAPGVVRRWFSI